MDGQDLRPRTRNLSGGDGGEHCPVNSAPGAGSRGPGGSVGGRNDRLLPRTVAATTVDTVLGKEKAAADSLPSILKCLSTLSSF